MLLAVGECQYSRDRTYSFDADQSANISALVLARELCQNKHTRSLIPLLLLTFFIYNL